MTVVAAMGKVTSLPRKALAALTVRRGRPTFFLEFTVVFALVAFLLLLATGLFVSHYIEEKTIDEVAASVKEVTSRQVAGNITQQQMDVPLTGEDYDRLNSYVGANLLDSRTVRVNIWSPDGRVIYSSSPGVHGRAFPLNDERESALSGATVTEIEAPDRDEHLGLEQYGDVLEVYTPLVLDGAVVGTLEIYRNYDPVVAQIHSLQRTVYGAIAVALGVLYVALILLVRSGSNLIRRQNSDLEVRADELKNSYESIVAVLCSALDLRDNVTHGHAQRVSEMASIVAWQMGMRKDEVRRMEKAAILHDIGKIGVADAVLRKPGPLDEAEWAEMKRHPELGHSILQGIDFLKDAADVVYAHHERWDGTGYPRGLKGEEIPRGARIFAIVDAYDAMTSHRPYRRAMSHRYAVQEILRHAGTQFDPEVVRAFTEAERRGLFSEGSHRQHADSSPFDAPAVTRS